MNLLKYLQCTGFYFIELPLRYITSMCILSVVKINILQCILTCATIQKVIFLSVLRVVTSPMYRFYTKYVTIMCANVLFLVNVRDSYVTSQFQNQVFSKSCMCIHPYLPHNLANHYY